MGLWQVVGRSSIVGWWPSLVVWRPSLVGWRLLLLGWRPSLVVWRPSPYRFFDLFVAFCFMSLILIRILFVDLFCFKIELTLIPILLEFLFLIAS